MEKTKEQWIDQAIENYKSENYEDALQACKYAIQIDPTFARAFNGKGLILEKLNRYTEALYNLRKASQLAPSKAKMHLDLANLLLKVGRYKDARKSYENAIELDVKCMQIYQKKIGSLIAKARQLAEKGLLYEAFNAYIAVKELDPFNELVWPEQKKLLDTWKNQRKSQQSQSQSQQSIEAFYNNQWELNSTIHPANCRCRDCYEF